MSHQKSSLGRRRLLLLGAAATAHTACSGSEPLGGPYGGATSGLPGPILGSSDTDGGSAGGGSGGGSGGGGGPIDAAACGSCPSGGSVLQLTFAKYPRLLNVGGSVLVSAPGYADPTCNESGILVFNNHGTYIALSSSCTHQCCTVTVVGFEVQCPCHGATFDLTGMPTNSVARRPLASLPVCADSCAVYVTA